MKSVNQIIYFKQASISDIAKVSGKNISLWEMFNQLNPKRISIPMVLPPLLKCIDCLGHHIIVSILEKSIVKPNKI